MHNDDMLDGILADLTPDRLREIVLGLSATKRGEEASGISMPEIMDTVMGGGDLGTGSEGWAATLRLKRAIIDRVGQIPGMQYVEGDA